MADLTITPVLAYNYRTESFVRDDFIASGNTTQATGELGWSFAGGTAAPLAGVAGHPGIVRLDSTASIGTVSRLSANVNGTGPIWADDTWDTTFVVRLNTNDTDTQVRVGLSVDASSDPATAWTGIEKLYADTSWFGVTRQASAQTRSSALVATGTGWLTVRIRRVSATTIGFTVNGGAETTQATNVPTGAGLEPLLQIKNQTAASKTVDIDYFDCRVTGLGRI